MSDKITRSIENITEEIQELKAEAQCTAVYYICRIGKRLAEAKSILPHGEWAEWLANKVEFSQRTASDFMRIYKEYGSDQTSLFGGNSQAIANLGYTKALQLLAIPAAEREEFVEENDVEELSTRQLADLIRERDEALKKAEETGKLQEQLDIANSRAKKSESEAAIAAQKLSEATAEKSRIEERLQSEREKVKKLKNNPNIPDELKDKLKQEAKAEAENKLAEQTRELDERIAKAKAEVENAQRAKEAAEAKAAELEKRLSMSDPAVTEFKSSFEQVQIFNGKCLEIIKRVENAETSNKLRAAMMAFLSQALESVKEG